MVASHAPASGAADDERTDGSPRRWALWPALVVVALVHGAFLHETLVGGKVLTQIDALLLFEPWASVAPEGFEASNPLLLDQALQMLPWLDFFQQRLAAGELPLWNPHAYAGHPVAAVPTGGLFWPLHWAYFAFPTWHYHAWSAWLRLVLTGAFALLFLRELGVSRAAAAPAAVAFSLCGFFVVWLNHPHTQVAMFLPLLLWIVERAARRPSASLVGATGLVTSLVFLGGHLQTAAHVLLGVAAYALFRAGARVGGRRLGRRGIASLAAGGVLGVLCSMPLLLPFAEYLGASHGAVVSAEQDLVSPVDPWKALVFLVSPDQFGHPQHGDYTGPLGAHLNYQELVGGWVGRLVLTLAAFALWLDRRNPRTWFFAALALVAVLVAFQVPPFYDAARAVPLVKSSKLMRLLLLAALSFTVLGAFGLDRLLQRLRPRIASAAGLAVTLVVALELGTWGHGYNPAVERDSPTFLPPTPASDFLARDDSLYRVLGQDATILIPNANMFYGVDTLTGYDAMEYRTMAELVARLTSDEQRETSIKEIRWFDRPLPLLGLLNVKYVLATAALPPPFELVLDGDVRVYENPWALPRAFVATDAVVLEDADERLDFLASPELDPRVAVLEERPSGGIGASAVGAGAAVGPPGTVAVETYEPRRVLLRAEMSRPGLVVLADAWDAAWVARVDGADAPIERVDHTLRGVWVGRGESVIEMAHEPASIRVGLACAAVGVAACVALLALGAGRRRRALRPLGGEVR